MHFVGEGGRSGGMNRIKGDVKSSETASFVGEDLYPNIYTNRQNAVLKASRVFLAIFKPVTVEAAIETKDAQSMSNSKANPSCVACHIIG